MSIAIITLTSSFYSIILESVFTSDGLNFSQECWTCISSLTVCRKFLTCDWLGLRIAQVFLGEARRPRRSVDDVPQLVYEFKAFTEGHLSRKSLAHELVNVRYQMSVRIACTSSCWFRETQYRRWRTFWFVLDGLGCQTLLDPVELIVCSRSRGTAVALDSLRSLPRTALRPNRNHWYRFLLRRPSETLQNSLLASRVELALARREGWDRTCRSWYSGCAEAASGVDWRASAQRAVGYFDFRYEALFWSTRHFLDLAELLLLGCLRNCRWRRTWIRNCT